MKLTLVGKQDGSEYWEALMDIPYQPQARIKFAQELKSVEKFEDKALAKGVPCDVIADWWLEFEHYRSPEFQDPSIRLMETLRQSIHPPEKTSDVDELEDAEEWRKPRFRTGLPALNNWTTGGGYGLTVIGGTAKAGKSMFAIGAALEAAKTGWRVVYFNAELTRKEAIQAVMRYSQGPIPNVVKDQMKMTTADYGFSPEDAIVRIGEQIRVGDERLLIVMDSIHALVDMSSGQENYWALNEIWRRFAVRATKQSDGQIAFIVVSELNKEGNFKGGQLDYKADLALRIQKVDGSDKMVEIDITHSRGTKAGSLGAFLRDWESGRFIK